MITNSVCVLLVIISMLNAGNGFNIQPKIINGLDSNRAQFPFYVFLRITERVKPKEISICGGTLLNEKFVLTAAHCIKGVRSVQIHLGSLRADDYSEPGRKIVYARPNNFFIHPKYDHYNIRNDVALIRMRNPVVFSKYIQPVQFPTECEINGYTKLIAIGNGFIDQVEEEFAPILQYTSLTTASDYECAERYPFIQVGKIFCATGSYNTSFCNGDSGGPAVHPIHHTIYGVASFTHVSGCNDLPQGLSNIFAYMPWISEVTGMELPDCGK